MREQALILVFRQGAQQTILDCGYGTGAHRFLLKSCVYEHSRRHKEVLTMQLPMASVGF
jgi:hypothetical protein